MNKSLDYITQHAARIVVLATAFLVPVFFLPFTSDFFSLSKLLVLAILASVSLLVWAARGVMHNRFDLKTFPASATLIIFGCIIVASSFFQSPNPRQALLGDAGVLLSLILLFLTSTAVVKSKQFAQLVFHALLAGTVLNAFVVIAEFTGMGAIVFAKSIYGSKLFNFTGGPVPFLALAVPVLVGLVVLLLKNRKAKVNPLYLISAVLVTVASGMSLRLLFTENFQFMPLTLGWVVAVRAMQNPVAALLGTGPSTFASVYTQLKPGIVNSTAVWNVPFASSASMYLQLMTTVGLGGLVMYVLSALGMATYGLKKAGSNEYTQLFAGILVSSLVIQLILPPNFFSLFTVFMAMLLLAFDSNSVKPSEVAEGALKKFEETLQANSEKLTLLYWFVMALVVAGVGTYGFQIGKAYASEVKFFQSYTAAQSGDGGKTYELQNAGVQLNPFNPTNRMVYSQTNFALASALASNKAVSEKDKATITQLIQQAIREAKVAIQLDQSSSVAWQNLANIYRQLIGLVEQSDEWTISAYQQAIALDPTNPQLALDLGGVYFGLKKYPEAISVFTQAVQLKQDWPNAYYNLSTAYKAADQPQAALEAMRVVVQLVDPASTDYQKAQDELNELQKTVDALNAKNTKKTDTTISDKEGETLVKPSPLPTPNPADEIALPSDAAPEATPAP